MSRRFSAPRLRALHVWAEIAHHPEMTDGEIAALVMAVDWRCGEVTEKYVAQVRAARAQDEAEARC